ncbi:MAG: bifunctional methylenetetrahydrofolate dehydrogenase/methenyltetrahydrofolate cyclohydrolase FolD [Legionellaceae bacterium]|nr:bifunctional methylenetetrahydrofolate dehydrogenase/methenyltetrahydrofolate cyclohydrolase FolD [Legionellaceae bacterium]
MTASIIDGKLVASKLKQSIKIEVEHCIQQNYRQPGLAVVLIGDDHASHLYVNSKRKACSEVGILSFAHHLPTKTSQIELLALIDALNQNEKIDGILVQLPLPTHINKNAIIDHIDPNKDVDGFHPYNFGRLAQGNPALRPCTSYGVIQLLNYYQLPIEGKHAVVIGASTIVGRPMALELLLARATVTICHSATKNLEQLVRSADIIISATGVRHVIDSAWLSKNQIVIDVGLHRLNKNEICGDVHFQKAKEQVAWITPVPGGVGPMTVATLLKNTVQAWKKANGQPRE